MTDSEKFQPQTLDDILTWLAGMPAAERAKVAGMLVDRPTIEAIGAARRGAVWELSREHGGQGAADLLGVSVKSVRKAIEGHNRAVNSQVQV